MTTRFPKPLTPGDRIAVTAPSSGVQPDLEPRLEVALQSLRDRGYEVVEGQCLRSSHVVSAPKAQRAAELVDFLCDPEVAAVVPPWGGELAIDLLDELDWTRLGAAEPTWLVGWSDVSTLLVPLTTRLGWATLHGWNLMDSPLAAPDGLLHWTELAAATGAVVQVSPNRTRDGWGDYRAPETAVMSLDVSTRVRVLDGGGVDVTGTLIGGCLEVLAPLAGTPYADVPAYGRAHAEAGGDLLVYLEAAEHGAYDVCRALHGLRLAGWFEHATAILIGRTAAPDAADLSQHEAVADALGMLDIPVVLDLDVGHTQPFLPLVNGAEARVVVTGERCEVTQQIG